ncbi:protein polyglycylase TTLL10 [Salarias fasciatus]|uniref:Tubulin tyrosine ligase-like family, member 10 n=1 Tax=Salarias fasciatus TaxID=181472 RepID=A0A672HDX9_SALFA|nr:inactive polyglycylase TTLL10 [Salarias fasciatus]XP_029973788.1 inactive polyglycylase TTLL10 [Salarias fasciatus]XP_029973789.1 inactive polyglycylase TTLL10 [Salarias fasciatus]
MPSKCLKEKQHGEERKKIKEACDPAGDSKQEDPGTESPPSPDCSGNEEASSGGGLEHIQGEEKGSAADRTRFSHLSASQEGQFEESVSAACIVERRHRRPKPRDKFSCSQRVRERQGGEPRGPGPFYFFGGTNGAEIVSQCCESRGWKRIYNKQREDFKLKWCETKSPSSYSNFREGEQLIYQIPNNKVLTTKIGLLSSLRQYERVSSKVSHGQELRRLKMNDFIPTTFRMDVREERETFFSQQEGLGCMWICKPTGLNQGRGIFLLRSQEDVAAFRLKLQRMEDQQGRRTVQHRRAQAHVVQHYIQRPLLLNGKKFDVRSYLLIACTAPYMVFFCHGYVRLTCDPYDPDSNDLSSHLTNQYMQKQNPLYSLLKDDTVWSMESFNAFVNRRFQVSRGLPRDWVLGAFTRRMQQIMSQCFFAVKSKLICRLGFFDLIGCDFLVDEDFKVWLLEMNCNPALHTNCQVLKEVVPRTVAEALDLTLEIFNKCRLRQKILPLASQREFVLLYNGALTPRSVPACRKSNGNAEFHQKPAQRTQKTESRRCRSATEGESDQTSPDTPVTVSESGERHKSQPSTITSTSCLKVCSKETVRTTRPRVQLKLSKCTLHHHLKTAGESKPPRTHQETRILTSLSSPALSERRFVSPETLFPEDGFKGDTNGAAHKTEEEV